MKVPEKNLLTLALPLSIILFGTVTRWRYVYIEDGPDDFLYGFPLTFICSGWHTSMSLQIFVLELVFDFFVYFIFCLSILTLIDRFYRPMLTSKYLKFGLYGFAAITVLLYGVIFANPDNLFKLKRDFDYKEIRSGYKCLWQEDQR